MVRRGRLGPGVKDKRLGTELRASREAAGLTLSAAAADLGWDKSKLSRTENGLRTANPDEVATLLGLYKITGERYDRLLATAKTLDEPGWWQQGLPGLPSDSGILADYESEAAKITHWAPLMIPGLLQTMDYSRAWMQADGIPDNDVEVRLTVRMRRQHVLVSESVDYVAYLGEAALRTPVGSAPVMTRQLDALLKASRRPNVSIRVVPTGVPTGRGQLGPFFALEFDEWSPVVHVELLRSGIFMDVDELTGPYLETVRHLDGVGLSEDETARMITRVKDEVGTWN